MINVFSIIVLLISVLLTVVVLIQNPKGGGLDSSFGGGNQVLGAAKSTDFIEKLTWILAGLLFVLCIAIAIYSGAGETAAHNSDIFSPE